MKTYNKPIISIENINIDDVILASFNEKLNNEVAFDWETGQEIQF